MGGEVEGGGRHNLAPIFSLVYATPLLQHQAKFCLNPALILQM